MLIRSINQIGGIMKLLRLFIVIAVMVGIFGFSQDVAAKVVKVTASVNPPDFSGNCPKRFEFTGEITVDKPCVVTYKWIRSDNAMAPVQTIKFKRPGTQKVSNYWELSAEGEHWEAVQVMEPNPMTSNKAVFRLKCTPRAVIAQPNLMVKKDLHIGQIVKQGCIDPAAYEIKFDIVRRYTQFRGRIRITGVVKNIGAQAFNSGPNQAKAYLYQLPPGVPPATATGGTVVAEREILNLAPGATINLSWERDWDSSSPSEGEFPNSYRLLISYDPDIYMDANKENDDCNQNNNKKERSGTEINDMLK